MRWLQKILGKITDHFRPWHANGLPEQLQLEPMEAELFYREEMWRNGSMAASLNVPFGIFDTIGIKYARQAAWAWRPRERLLMEDVSLAFHVFEQLRQRGERVPANDIERLAITLTNYFQEIGESRSRADVRTLIKDYLAAHSLPDDGGIRPSTPVRVMHPLLEELREFEAELQRTSKGCMEEDTLDWVSLLLDKQLDAYRYDFCTPLNVRTFAGTGGDGHHFSFLVQNGTVDASSPVILTQPDNCGESCVVGEDLQEFLCLGCRGGYADVLGQRPEVRGSDAELRGIDDHTYAPYLAENQVKTLQALSLRFGLKPWTDPHRFAELQAKYASLLILPPDVRR